MFLGHNQLFVKLSALSPKLIPKHSLKLYFIILIKHNISWFNMFVIKSKFPFMSEGNILKKNTKLYSNIASGTLQPSRVLAMSPVWLESWEFKRKRIGMWVGFTEASNYIWKLNTGSGWAWLSTSFSCIEWLAIFSQLEFPSFFFLFSVKKPAFAAFLL